MHNKKYISLIVIASIAIIVPLLSVPAFAQTNNGTTISSSKNNKMHMQSGIFGTVSAINGTTLTVTEGKTNTSYSVDASNATVNKNGSASSLSAINIGDTVMIKSTVNGTSITAKVINNGVTDLMFTKNRGIRGTITSINGTTLTITSKMNEPNNGTGVTYTVDAANAKITKNGETISISNLSVGDTLIIKGTVNGSNITATTINDNLEQEYNKSNPMIEGNGNPIIGGNITAINGTTLTVTNKSNVAYTIDASNAKVEKGGVITSLSNVAVGDTVIAQGTINGTLVTASSMIDQSKPASTSTNATSKFHFGFLGGIINFFQHFFGF